MDGKKRTFGRKMRGEMCLLYILLGDLADWNLVC